MGSLRVWRCDRCGYEMVERHCKVVCPNCGARWDCSDVTIWVGDAQARLTTRRYRPQDRPVLARQWRNAPSAASLNHRTSGAWLLLEGEAVRGYAALFPVPGLPSMHQLLGEVQPAHCAQGAPQLLRAVLQGADRERVRQITYDVDSLENEATRFLLAHGFAPEHEEWHMQGTLPPQQARKPLPDGYRICVLPYPEAVAHFLRLYEESFAPEPWYQPYSRAELVAELRRGEDMLLLCHGETPVGFAWLRTEGDKGEVEPIGIIPAHQGLGLGRSLFLEALWRLSERGLRQATVGVWRQNERAVRIYRSAGLRVATRRHYLAYEVE